MKPHEIQEKLGLTRISDRSWYVQPACAVTGDGLYEGLNLMINNKHKQAHRYDNFTIKNTYNYNLAESAIFIQLLAA
ncbi:ADP-ribosylation factor 6 [Orchesella cincta]|uniref:ADP-ribosylation factor 6 n=1 Tax=Orchesella cincta TaxID=48709 RepID=A0A1D2MY03_ORCCI|nr:ADP-ribosylation factor 6 [Orchesella cincta]